MGQLSVKDLISIHDLSREDIELIFEKSKFLKKKQKNREPHEILRGRTICSIYEKPSLRTRVSFETAMVQLGGHCIYLKAIPDWEKSDVHLKESEEDIAKVLSRYVDAIVLRTFEHDMIVKFAEHATIPVVNALSNLTHPCQTLADLFTALEHKDKLEGLKMAYIGDGGCNTAHSSLLGCTKMGMDISIASPPQKKYRPNPRILKWAEKDAKETNAKITITDDPKEAAIDADIINVDVWISMGMEAETEERLKVFSPYRVDSKLVQLAKDDVIVMHCLPRTEYEIADDVVNDPAHSVIFDEAENRLHIQKGLLALLIDYQKDFTKLVGN